MKIDMSDAIIRQSPVSIIGQLPVEQLSHPVIITLEGENTGLHELKDVLIWMTRHTPSTGPLTRKVIHMNDIEPVLLEDAFPPPSPPTPTTTTTTTTTTTGRILHCRYQDTLNTLLATAVEYGESLRTKQLLDMRADPSRQMPYGEGAAFMCNSLHTACSARDDALVRTLLTAASIDTGAGGPLPRGTTCLKWLNNDHSPGRNTPLHLVLLGLKAHTQCLTQDLKRRRLAETAHDDNDNDDVIYDINNNNNNNNIIIDNHTNNNNSNAMHRHQRRQHDSAASAASAPSLSSLSSTSVTVTTSTSSNSSNAGGSFVVSTTIGASITITEPCLVLVNLLLQSKANPNAINADGETPLTLALRRDCGPLMAPHTDSSHVASDTHRIQLGDDSGARWRTQLVQTLLSAGADTEPVFVTRFNFSRAPLRAAIENACSLDVVKLLIDSNACPRGVYYRGQPSNLMVAVQHGLQAHISLLVSAGANLRDADLDGNTVWHHAAMRNGGRTIQALRTVFPDALMDEDNVRGDTPLHMAALHFATSATAALLRPSPSSSISSSTTTIVAHPPNNNNAEEEEEDAFEVPEEEFSGYTIIDTTNTNNHNITSSNNNEPPHLFSRSPSTSTGVVGVAAPKPQQKTTTTNGSGGGGAAHHNNDDRQNGLLLLPLIQHYNQDGLNPAHTAIVVGNIPFLMTAIASDRNLSAFVCSQPTREKLPPLHLAVLAGRADTVSFLLEVGADPLQTIHTFTTGTVKPPRSFLSARIDPDSHPLHLALTQALYQTQRHCAPVSYYSVALVLIKAGADTNRRNPCTGDAPLHLLMRPPATPAGALSSCVVLNHTREATDLVYMEKVFACLVQHGADINLPRAHSDCGTPLHVAVSGTGTASTPLLKRLLAARADPNCCEKRSLRTPLHLAARHPKTMRFIPLLLDAGADPHLVDTYSMSPLELVEVELERLTKAPGVWSPRHILNHQRASRAAERLRAALTSTSIFSSIPTAGARAATLPPVANVAAASAAGDM